MNDNDGDYKNLICRFSRPWRDPAIGGGVHSATPPTGSVLRFRIEPPIIL